MDKPGCPPKREIWTQLNARQIQAVIMFFKVWTALHHGEDVPLEKIERVLVYKDRDYDRGGVFQIEWKPGHEGGR